METIPILYKYYARLFFIHLLAVIKFDLLIWVGNL